VNRYYFEYIFATLISQKKRNIFMVVILFLVVFVLGSVLFLSSALQNNAQTLISAMPQIIVQKRVAQRHKDIDINAIYPVLDITGVSKVVPRIWGLYKFEKAEVAFSIIAVDGIDYDYLQTLGVHAPKKGTMVVGSGVAKILHQNYYDQFFHFVLPNGSIKKITLSGVFLNRYNSVANDVILLDPQDARDILGIQKGYVSDFAVFVPNKDEIPTIAQKIQLLYPDATLITQEEMLIDTISKYNFKGGLFLSLYLIVFVIMFIVVADRLSGVSSSEKKEVATLKAIGWSIRKIIKAKLIEAFIVSSFAYILGVLGALCYVFFFGAPFLRELFVGFGALQPPVAINFSFDLSIFVILFFISVALYVAAVIFPTWRVAVTDVDEVLR
jgi:ABC-type lipoprotein release transport system permease subunit